MGPVNFSHNLSAMVAFVRQIVKRLLSVSQLPMLGRKNECTNNNRKSCFRFERLLRTAFEYSNVCYNSNCAYYTHMHSNIRCCLFLIETGERVSFRFARCVQIIQNYVHGTFLLWNCNLDLLFWFSFNLLSSFDRMTDKKIEIIFAMHLYENVMSRELRLNVLLVLPSSKTCVLNGEDNGKPINRYVRNRLR